MYGSRLSERVIAARRARKASRGGKFVLNASTYLIDRQYQLPRGTELHGAGSGPCYRATVSHWRYAWGSLRRWPLAPTARRRHPPPYGPPPRSCFQKSGAAESVRSISVDIK